MYKLKPSRASKKMFRSSEHVEDNLNYPPIWLSPLLYGLTLKDIYLFIYQSVFQQKVGLPTYRGLLTQRQMLPVMLRVRVDNCTPVTWLQISKYRVFSECSQCYWTFVCKTCVDCVQGRVDWLTSSCYFRPTLGDNGGQTQHLVAWEYRKWGQTRRVVPWVAEPPRCTPAVIQIWIN